MVCEIGKVLPIGGDWALIEANGTLTADVRQTFETDDGAHIQVFESGSTQPDGTAHVRFTFETGAEKYYWLNSIVGVGILKILPTGQLTIDAWQVSISINCFEFLGYGGFERGHFIDSSEALTYFPAHFSLGPSVEFRHIHGSLILLV
jgi:hypothetical protein